MGRAPELAAAAACYAAAFVCCAGSWRALLPHVRLRDALPRYGVGSLANTLLPARAGDAVRVGLFARIVPGGALAVVGAVAVAGTARWLALTPFGIAGTLDSHLPRVALLGGAAIVLPLPLAYVLARRGCVRAARILLPLRAARTGGLCAVAGWSLGIVAARVVAATAVGQAFGLRHPLAAALLVVPALEVAGIVPLTPANVGVAGGAAALAFHAHGAEMKTALAAGLTLHAVETATAVVIGAASAVRLVGYRPAITLRSAFRTLAGSGANDRCSANDCPAPTA
ncbi:MAG TPA: lysylphosphatidylglycerol synthase domain-containing protein [Gaiellaceae bacterium]|nr:lysylphosphatidylglycerol synthase domain-containing protein [Gaiellaceae bacterium]